MEAGENSVTADLFWGFLEEGTRVAGTVSHSRLSLTGDNRGSWRWVGTVFLLLLFFVSLVELGEEKGHLSLVKGH